MIKKNKNIICLGAGYSQIPYIKNLKDKNYYIIAVDQNVNAPGFQFADVKIAASTFDHEKTPSIILEFIQELPISYAIAPCTGPPYKTLNKLKRLLNLPFVKDKSLEILLDKKALRKHLNDLGCSKIDLYENADLLDHNCFPLVKKPRFEGLGGKGVRFFNSNRFLKDSPLDKDYVYEHLISGNEIAVDAVWNGNKIVFLNLGWTIFDNNLGINIGATSHMDNKLLKIKPKIIRIIEKICASLEIGPEFLNMDIMIDASKNLHVIEIEFVPADAIHLCKATFDFDVIENYIALNTNNKIAEQKEIKNAAVLLIFNNSKTNIADSKEYISKRIKISPYTINTKTSNIEVKELELITAKNYAIIKALLKKSKLSIKRIINE